MKVGLIESFILHTAAGGSKSGTIPHPKQELSYAFFEHEEHGPIALKEGQVRGSEKKLEMRQSSPSEW